MTQSHHTFTLPEVIASHNVVARLYRNHFHLTRASVKEIIANHQIAGIIEIDKQRNTQVVLAQQFAMIHPVALSRHINIILRLRTVIGIIVIYDTSGQTAVLCIILATSKFYYRAARRSTIAKLQSAYYQELATHDERRTPCNKHSTRLGLYGDGGLLRCHSLPLEVDVAIRTCLDDNAVACHSLLQAIGHPWQGGHIIACLTCHGCCQHKSQHTFIYMLSYFHSFSLYKQYLILIIVLHPIHIKGNTT